MSDYFGAAMRLTLEHLVDWETLLAHRRGERIDVAAELGAFTTLLETAAGLAQGFEAEARAHWHAEAALTEDAGATSPPHIRRAYDALRAAGLTAPSVGEAWGGFGVPALVNERGGNWVGDATSY